jgi:murein DD-endopeptidase MepM/ murein hydrolase activator NlpD
MVHEAGSGADEPSASERNPGDHSPGNPSYILHELNSSRPTELPSASFEPSRYPAAFGQGGFSVEWHEMTPALVAPGRLTLFTQRLTMQIQQTLSDQVTPLRLAGHLSVLGIAAVILVLSQVQIPSWDLNLQATPNPNLVQNELLTNQVGSLLSSAQAVDDFSLRKAIVPFTIVPAKQETKLTTPVIYTVQSGDTVLGIAAKYGLQPETIMWSNSELEQNPDRLAIGDQLRILPVDGLLHVVEPGDTLSSLADDYETTIDAIVGYSANAIADASANLSVGKEIVVPGGVKVITNSGYWVDSQVSSVAYPSGGPVGSGNFSWPSAGYISQGYWGGHPAIDIAGWEGSPVSAADGGYVVTAGGGWNSGYGNQVIIDHGNGFVSLYAHMSSVFVTPGMTVSKGTQIGTMGNTGNSTGPHLHLEIRYGGVPYNPAGYLP